MEEVHQLRGIHAHRRRKREGLDSAQLPVRGGLFGLDEAYYSSSFVYGLSNNGTGNQLVGIAQLREVSRTSRIARKIMASYFTAEYLTQHQHVYYGSGYAIRVARMEKILRAR